LADERLAAAFFIPRPAGELPIEVLAAKAGVQNLRPGEPLEGTWAGMPASVIALPLDLHVLLIIFFPLNAFFDRVADKTEADLPLADDPALPVAQAFRDAALAVGAQVALLLTHPHQGDADRIEEHYTDVLGKNEEALANERFGLLYLDDEMSGEWTPDPDRDSLPVPSGHLIFAHRGWGRWF
jgi:hypothetical protein